MDSKQRELDKIAFEIEHCDECKRGKVGQAVPGEGNPDADILFVGEAPGRNESATGRPFIGRSGKLLRENIRRIGLKEEDVYITSPVKYLPEYKTPKPSDIEHGLIHFKKQVAIINPRIIVPMGRVACLAVLGRDVQVSKEHGKLEEGKYFIMYHPSAAIRFKKFKIVFEHDFDLLKQIL
ncbi:MAG: uracil-DNA glycosylase [Candidatus Levyibacteriota bacterium]